MLGAFGGKLYALSRNGKTRPLDFVGFALGDSLEGESEVGDGDFDRVFLRADLAVRRHLGIRDFLTLGVVVSRGDHRHFVGIGATERGETLHQIPATE